MTPTERTLRWLRKQGYTCQVVERRIPHTFVTKDLFGCIDIVAIKAGIPGVLGVQVTSRAHLADRLAKVKREPRAALWRECRNDLLVVGWSKRGEAGRRKLWEVEAVRLAPRIISGWEDANGNMPHPEAQNLDDPGRFDDAIRRFTEHYEHETQR